jgi:segregation and condensation protein A
MHKIKIAKFEGPLDLLLQLIEQQEMDICEVSLAQVTEQYIQYLNQLEALAIEDLADFLSVAARLLLIKSKALMPYLTWGEAEETDDLEKQLKIYREYLEASRLVRKLILKRRFTYAREKLPQIIDEGFNPPKNVTTMKLKNVFMSILRELEPLTRLPQGIIKKTINIQEKIQKIRQLIIERVNLNFEQLIRESKSKTEVIVSFLAILELVKQRIVIVHQDKVFGGMSIEKTITNNN